MHPRPQLCRSHTLLSFIRLLYSFLPPQFVQEGLKENDTVLQFYSPTVNCSCNIQSLRTLLQLDNVEEELKSFAYHPDPTFDELQKKAITETGIIIVTVRTPSRCAGLLRASHLTLGFRSGSRLRQGHDGQRGEGVCGRRPL